MHKRFTRLWPWLLLAVFLLSLVPVLWLGQYARAGADDYCYGIAVHRALQEGGSLLEAVWHTISGYYQSWQGTFSALAFMSLTPCSWSEGAYWITPVVMLVSLAGGTFYLSGVLCRRLLGGSRRDGILVALALLFPSIQCLAQPLHSFYWWNGAVYYTFTYGLSLFYLAGLTGLFLPGRPRPRALAVGALLGILVGGSNYASALLTALLGLTALALIPLLWRLAGRTGGASPCRPCSRWSPSSSFPPRTPPIFTPPPAPDPTGCGISFTSPTSGWFCSTSATIWGGCAGSWGSAGFSPLSGCAGQPLPPWPPFWWCGCPTTGPRSPAYAAGKPSLTAALRPTPGSGMNACLPFWIRR